MGLRFSCRTCGKDILVRYLKVGEAAECRLCGMRSPVPASAESVDDESVMEYQSHPMRGVEGTEEIGIGSHQQEETRSYLDWLREYFPGLFPDSTQEEEDGVLSPGKTGMPGRGGEEGQLSGAQLIRDHFRQALLLQGLRQTWQNIYLWGLSLVVIVFIVTYSRVFGLVLYGLFVLLTARDFLRLSVYGISSLFSAPVGMIMGVVREDEELFSSGYYALIGTLANAVFLAMYVGGAYMVYRQASSSPLF